MKKTIIGQGMVLASTGLDFRRRDYIDREAVQKLAHEVVQELQPRYAYCTGIFGWNGAWVKALLEARIPYCMVLPYRSVGTKWFHGSKAELDTATSNAESVVYISDKYTDTVYADRDGYLVSRAEGVVTFTRPLIANNRVSTMAIELGLPVLELWGTYINLLDQEGKV